MNKLESLGTTAAEIMETLEHTEIPDEAEIAEVMIIVAVTWPVDNPEAIGHSLFYRCTSNRPWIQHGLLDLTSNAVDGSIQSG